MDDPRDAINILTRGSQLRDQDCPGQTTARDLWGLRWQNVAAAAISVGRGALEFTTGSVRPKAA